MARNTFDWPESHMLLVDYMNSFYLNKEPDTRSIRDTQNGNTSRAAIFIHETCERDLHLCLHASKMPFDYWTSIFSVLQFSILASWILLEEDDRSCIEAAWSILSIASKAIQGILARNIKVRGFEKGFLYELKGDVEIMAGETRRAGDSYSAALVYYKPIAFEDEKNLVLYPEVEPLFLQCDVIWHGKLDLYFADSYDYVRDFSKRIEAKLQMANDSSGKKCSLPI